MRVRSGGWYNCHVQPSLYKSHTILLSASVPVCALAKEIMQMRSNVSGKLFTVSITRGEEQK